MPERFLDWAKGSFDSKASVILLMNFMMLVAGMFIDLPAAILLLAPLFVPLATSYGIDLVQLAHLSGGQPSNWPLHAASRKNILFIGSMISGASIGRTVKELLPFYIVGLIVLALMSYVPAFTLRM